MNILDIYQKYGIPRKLQLHMLRAAACADMIQANWKGPKVNRNKLMRVLLLHDMGNIVKIGADEFEFPEFVENRKKYFEQYGKDDHKISEAIAKEIGLSEDEITMMNEKIFLNTDNIIKSNDYELKIAAYCDQRVAPYGVCDMMERLLECKERSKNKPGSSMSDPRADFMIECAKTMEDQVMQYCTITAEEINDQTIDLYMKALEEFKI